MYAVLVLLVRRLVLAEVAANLAHLARVCLAHVVRDGPLGLYIEYLG